MQSFIGLPSMVPVILWGGGGGGKEPLQDLQTAKKPGPNRFKAHHDLKVFKFNSLHASL